MPRTRKKQALLWAVTLACLAFLALCFIGFDAGVLKGRIVAEVKARKTRSLELNGSLRLKILPRLAVEMNDVRLSGPNGEGEFLKIGRLEGALEILPLIKGRYSVNRIEARDFALFAERNEDGSTNFDDLFAKDEETDQTALDFAIGRIALQGGRLSWHEVASGERFILDDVYLRSGAVGATAEGSLAVGGKVTAAPLEGAVFALDSRYRLDGSKLWLDEPRLTLETPAKEQIRGTVRQIVADLDAPALSMTGMKLEGHHDQLAANLELDEFNWRQEVGSASGGSLQLSWMPDDSDKPAFSLEAKLDALAGEGGNWQGKAEATFQGNWQDSKLTGRLALPFAIQAVEGALSVETLDVAAKTAGRRLKEALDMRLQGNLEVRLPDGAASGKWQISQADSRLDFDWQLNWPLRFVFKAALNRLDVDRYWSMAGATEEQADKVDAASSSDFSGELDGVLRIGELLVNGIRIENLESRIVWTNGKLAVTAQSGEGKVSDEGAAQKAEQKGSEQKNSALREGI
ncbi:MAG: AsmA family protein [Betaproteobacteria bacterium]|nr:AsmA family protein [Betaproteobacteria bacterium]